MGREFDDGTLSWDDLYAVIFAAPPGSAVFHAVEKGWDTNSHLLAFAVDTLRIANWQRTEDATKKPPRNVPEPFPRPGDSDRSTKPAGVVSVGGASATVTTVGKFLEMRAERERQWRLKHEKGG